MVKYIVHEGGSMEEHPRYLTEEDIDRIANKAAEKAIEKVYTEIGKNVVSKVFYFVGAVALALGAWLSGKGYFHQQ
jgi:hypothetical protein